MGRWFLNNLATWQLALLIVGGTMTVALTLHRLVKGRFSHVVDDESRELAGKLLGVMMAMFGFLLAFLIVSMYAHHQAADTNVQLEATQLSNMYRGSRVFEPAAAAAVRDAIGQYIDTIVEEERVAMAQGHLSPDSSEDIVRLYDVVEDYEPKTHAQDSFYGQAVSSLSQLNVARRTRINDVTSSLPGAFLFLIWGGAVVLILFLSLFATNQSWFQTMMVGAVAAFIGVNLFLMTTLNHPFSGDISVSLGPFTEGALGEIRAGTAP